MQDDPLPDHVSIHAPARGATRKAGLILVASASFNPRAREGRDGLGLVLMMPLLMVSIHAPARGATGTNAACG